MPNLNGEAVERYTFVTFTSSHLPFSLHPDIPLGRGLALFGKLSETHEESCEECFNKDYPFFLPCFPHFG